MRPQDDLPQASPAISPPASDNEDMPASIQDSASDLLEASGPAAGIGSGGSEQDEEFEGGESGEDEEQDQARQEHRLQDEAGFAGDSGRAATFGAQPHQDQMQSPAQGDSQEADSQAPAHGEEQQPLGEDQEEPAQEEEGEDEEEGEYMPEEGSAGDSSDQEEEPASGEEHGEGGEEESNPDAEASQSNADVPMAHEEAHVEDEVEMFLQPKGSQADHAE